MPLGGRVDDEECLVRQGLEHLCRLPLVEVEAPFPRGHRYAAPESVDRDSHYLDCISVKHGRRGPEPRDGFTQVLDPFVVARYEYRLGGDRGERLDRLVEAFVDRGEVPGADHQVNLTGHVDQPGTGIEVAVDVTEGEDLHRFRLYRRPG